MLAKLEQSAAPVTASDLKHARHFLFVLPKAAKPASLPHGEALAAALARRKKKPEDLAKSPVATDPSHGALAAWVILDSAKTPFEQQTLLRKALSLVLAEKPETLGIGVFGSPAERQRAARLAVYAAWVNGAPLPERKKEPDSTALRTVRVHGHHSQDGYEREQAIAAANLLCRELTALPPNELTPGSYRKRVKELARSRGWRHEEYDLKRLRKMGAGAFIAVARGSADGDAAIVHLR